MDKEHFKGKTCSQLQKILKERGVSFTGERKQGLVELCWLANEIGLEVDPDGLLEDREDILKEKLYLDDGKLLKNPFELKTEIRDLSLLPFISLYDIFNYLESCQNFDKNVLRNYKKTEGFILFDEGYVQDITTGPFENFGNYVFRVSKVCPKTREKDPITKLPYYTCWVIFSKIQEESIIKSAYCVCKGG